MKITKRQLRRIIREALPPHDVISAMTNISMEPGGPADPRLTKVILDLEYVEEALTIMDDEHLRAKVENAIKTLRDVS